MSKKTTETLADLVRKHGVDTHAMRIKLAAPMFRYYCGKMPECQAKLLTCELLQISAGGFESGLKNDYIGELEAIRRNQKILDMRCEGFSFASIAKYAKLSRVQVWRIMKDFDEKNQRIKALENKRVSNHKLKYSELQKIEGYKLSKSALCNVRYGFQ